MMEHVAPSQKNKKFWYLKVMNIEGRFHITLWTKSSRKVHAPYSLSRKNMKDKVSWGRIATCKQGKENFIYCETPAKTTPLTLLKETLFGFSLKKFRIIYLVFIFVTKCCYHNMDVMGTKFLI